MLQSFSDFVVVVVDISFCFLFRSLREMFSYLPTFLSPETWACLHGDKGHQEGEVTRLGGVTCLSIESLLFSSLHYTADFIFSKQK